MKQENKMDMNGRWKSRWEGGKILWNYIQGIMKLNEFLSGIGQPVAYYPQLARIFGGVKPAIFLCQFAYWEGKQKNKCVFKTRTEIENETGLTVKEQIGACHVLSEQKLLKVTRMNRVPPINQYCFDWDMINAL